MDLNLSNMGKMSSSLSAAVPNQDHVDWESPSIQETVKMMETSYPGGIAGYVKKAQHLLAPHSSSSASTATTDFAEQSDAVSASRNLKNPAHKVDINVADASAENMENLRLGNMIAGQQTLFVLVAGGLGERLGAKCLKLSLPIYTCDQDTYLSSNPSASVGEHDKKYTKTDFIAYYLSWMAHLRSVSNSSSSKPADSATPVIIMTSDDTHCRTLGLLEDFFAAFPQSRSLLDIKLVKQNGVPCVSDNNGKLATTPDGKSFLMKPHGHGDVHRLILSSGIVPPLLRKGYRYIAFLQDTNAGAPTTIPFSLAVMEKRNWTMSFTCVPRLPGEAIGALVEADAETPNHASSEKKNRVTYCVEYNVLDEMLKNEGIAGGDSVPTFPPENPKYSPFPGTINTLLLQLPQYNETIERTQGVIAEFINPKYADPKQKTAFKSPARLETLMQDIALELSHSKNNNPSATVIIGACVFDRRTYFPVKNALNDGIAKWKAQGIDPHNGSQGEAGFHLMQRMLWANFVNEKVSVSTWPLVKCVPALEDLQSDKNCTGAVTWNFTDVVVEKTLPVALFPILISESFGKEGLVGIAKHFASSSSETIKISRRSALVLKGNVVIKSLNLDGALVIDATSAKDDEIIVDLPSDYILSNRGWKVVAIEDLLKEEGRENLDEAHQLRGYKFVQEETRVISIPSNSSNAEGKRTFVLAIDHKTGESVLTLKNLSNL